MGRNCHNSQDRPSAMTGPRRAGPFAMTVLAPPPRDVSGGRRAAARGAVCDVEPRAAHTRGRPSPPRGAEPQAAAAGPRALRAGRPPPASPLLGQGVGQRGG